MKKELKSGILSADKSADDRPINRPTFFLVNHGGNSKGTTCVVDRDVTAYLVVDRVLRFPTEQYGCRYGGYPGFNDVIVICLGIFCYFTFRICF